MDHANALTPTGHIVVINLYQLINSPLHFINQYNYTGHHTSILILLCPKNFSCLLYGFSFFVCFVLFVLGFFHSHFSLIYFFNLPTSSHGYGRTRSSDRPLWSPKYLYHHNLLSGVQYIYSSMHFVYTYCNRYTI